MNAHRNLSDVVNDLFYFPFSFLQTPLEYNNDVPRINEHISIMGCYLLRVLKGLAMRIFVSVKGPNGKPNVGFQVSLCDATGIGQANRLRNAPMLRMNSTDASGKIEFDFDIDNKVQKIVFILKEPKKGDIIDVGDAIPTKNIVDGMTINFKTPILGETSVEPGMDETTEIKGESDEKGSLLFKRFSHDVESKYFNRDTTISGIGKVNEARRKVKLDKRTATRAKIRELLRKPSARFLPSNPEFQVASKDPKKTFEVAQEKGLENVNRADQRRRGIVVRHGTESIESLFDKSKVTSDAAKSILFPNSPPSSQRAENLLVDCYLRRKQAEFNEDAENSKAKTVSSSIPAALQQSPSINEQLQQLLDRAGDIALGNRPDVEVVNENLQRQQLANGPADTTAIYDFDTVQIAWKNVWDTVLDEQATKEISELYLEVLALQPDLESVADLSDIDDLNALFAMLHEAVSDISEELDIPDYVISWCPEINSLKDRLRGEDIEYLRFLWYVDIRVNQDHPKRNGEPNFGKFGDLFFAERWWPMEWEPTASLADLANTNWAINKARAYISQKSNAGVGRLFRLILDMQKYLVESYKFDVFLPNSYNFGFVSTYRQHWEPQGFQAGELISTLPLSPGEVRKVTIRHSVKSETEQKSKTVRSEKDTRDRKDTSKATGEINRKVDSKLSGKFGTKVKYKSFEATGEFSSDQGAESSRLKTELREAVKASVQEYSDERTVDVSAATNEEIENQNEVEIRNPNNELTVTYLFYELQQRFFVKERLHNVAPVVMVAFEVPAPHEITEAWLMRHEWILRDALLDEKLAGTLAMLSTSFAGEEVGLEILKRQWLAQIKTVEEYKVDFKGHYDLRNDARARITEIMEDAQQELERDEALGEMEDSQKRFIHMLSPSRMIMDAMFGRKDKDKDPLAEPEYDGARQALEWMESDLADAEAKRRSALSALENVTQTYVDAVKKSYNRRIAIDHLRVHVKQNILHYMQAIWSAEVPDQRYLRLYDLEIQWPQPIDDASILGGLGNFVDRGVASSLPSVLGYPSVAGFVKMPKAKLGETRYLHEVADLDRVVGFKGNYAIFNLKEGNALTDYMAQDFLDSEFGIYDPDPDGEVLSALEVLDLAHCAWQNKDLTDEDKKQIQQWMTESLKIAHRQGQEVVVPTGELFIEALPGSHTLLEDFKLVHRQVDVEKAIVERQMSQVELLRRAARLQVEDFADPNIDKQISVSGISNVDVDLSE